MIKRIDSRKTQTSTDNQPNGDSPRRVYSPNRMGAIAALGVLSAVGLASQVDIKSDTGRDKIPVSVSTEDQPNIVTPGNPVLEPGSVLAVAEAQKVADITNPDETARMASIEEAKRLTGFQP
jgi:hypothetical protein